MKKPEPVYKTDEFLRGKGHDVLRLPHTIVNLTLLKWYGGCQGLDGEITLLKLMM
jgi:hypothetical protein